MDGDLRPRGGVLDDQDVDGFGEFAAHAAGAGLDAAASGGAEPVDDLGDVLGQAEGQ
jgi:hypothetical protein